MATMESGTAYLCTIITEDSKTAHFVFLLEQVGKLPSGQSIRDRDVQLSAIANYILHS